MSKMTKDPQIMDVKCDTGITRFLVFSQQCNVIMRATRVTGKGLLADGIGFLFFCPPWRWEQLILPLGTEKACLGVLELPWRDNCPMGRIFCKIEPLSDLCENERENSSFFHSSWGNGIDQFHLHGDIREILWIRWHLIWPEKER